MNHRAKFDTASFILDATEKSVTVQTNKQTDKQTVNNISTPYSDQPTERRASSDDQIAVSTTRRLAAAAGPRVWNMLSIHLRLCDSLEQFKRLLKTNLFGVWGRRAL